jgi:hypothetical protein
MTVVGAFASAADFHAAVAIGIGAPRRLQNRVKGSPCHGRKLRSPFLADDTPAIFSPKSDQVF